MTSPQTHVYKFTAVSVSTLQGSTTTTFLWTPIALPSAFGFAADPLIPLQYTITQPTNQSGFIITNLNPNKPLTGNMIITWVVDAVTTPPNPLDILNFTILKDSSSGIYQNGVDLYIPAQTTGSLLFSAQQVFNFSTSAFNPLVLIPTGRSLLNTSVNYAVATPLFNTRFTVCSFSITQ